MPQRDLNSWVGSKDLPGFSLVGDVKNIRQCYKTINYTEKAHFPEAVISEAVGEKICCTMSNSAK